jgi:hypothetical protein
MKPLRTKRAGRAATGLAVASVVMVLVALAAAFAPPLHLIRTSPPAAASTTPTGSTIPSTAADPRSPSRSPSAYFTPRSPARPPPLAYSPRPVKTYLAPSAPQAGEFCPTTDHGLSRLTSNGTTVVCLDNNGWRWEPAPPPSPAPPPGADLPPVNQLVPPLAGVVTTDVPGWDAATSSHAQLAVSYVSMAVPLAPTFLHSVMRVDDGAEPVIEILPTSPGQPVLTLEQIASGSADAWLGALAAQITALGRPVVLSFAPEADGSWYAWSHDPVGFRAAWQHVHQVIGTSWVTWMWQMSATPTFSSATMAAWWPGSGEVDWVGLDGYLYAPGDSFALRFTAALAAVEGLWGGPIIIAETSVAPALDTTTPPPPPAPGSQAAGVNDLFNGVAAYHLLGLIYFDLNVCPPAGCGPYKQDFRIEANPAAVTAYRQAVNGSW